MENPHIWEFKPSWIGEFQTKMWTCKRCGDWMQGNEKPADYSRRNNGLSCDEVILKKIHAS